MLRRGVQRQSVSVGLTVRRHDVVPPDRDHGVRFEWIVVFLRGGVPLIDHRLGAGERRVDVASLGVGFVAAVDGLGCVRVRMVGAEERVVRFLAVLDLQERACLPGDLEGLRDDRADDLTPVQHVGCLQDGVLVLGLFGETWGVPGSEDLQHPGHRFCGGGVDAVDASTGDGGGERYEVGGIVDRVLVGVRCRPGDFAGPSMRAVERPPARIGSGSCGSTSFPSFVEFAQGRHHGSPQQRNLVGVAVEGTRVGEFGLGRRSEDLVGGLLPEECFLRAVCPPGRCATPPNAMRHPVIVPSATVISAATETNAKA